MSEINIPKNSYLNFAKLWTYEGITFFDVPDWPEIPETESDRYITIDSGYVGRLDLISYDEYGTTDLWWVIALANNMNAIPSDVKLNQRIRIPSTTIIEEILRNNENGA